MGDVSVLGKAIFLLSLYNIEEKVRRETGSGLTRSSCVFVSSVNYDEQMAEESHLNGRDISKLQEKR